MNNKYKKFDSIFDGITFPTLQDFFNVSYSDITYKESETNIKATLPGFNKDNTETTLSQDNVVIRDKQNKSVIFSHKFNDINVDLDNSSISFQDGVATITIGHLKKERKSVIL